MKFLSFLRYGGDAIPLPINGMEEGNCYLRWQKSLSFMCSAAQKSILWSAARKRPGARLTLPWGGGPSMIWCATNTDLERGQQFAPF